MKQLKFDNDISIPVEDELYEQLEEELLQIKVLSSLLDLDHAYTKLLCKLFYDSQEFEARESLSMRDNENYVLMQPRSGYQYGLVIRWDKFCLPCSVMYFSENAISHTGNIEYGIVNLKSKNTSEQLLEALKHIKEAM